MAYTNSRLFTYRKNLLGLGSSPTPLKIIIANSSTVKIGQMARVNTAGFLVAAGAGNTVAVLGRISGLVDNNGIPVLGQGYNANLTGHTASGDDTVTSASNNQTRTVAVYAFVEVGLESVLFFNAANGALAQTNLLQFFNLISTSDQIDQSTASDTIGQMQLVELNPDNDTDTTKGLFRVAVPQLSAQINNATAIIAA